MGSNSIIRSISVIIPFGNMSFGDNCIEIFNRIIKKVLFNDKQEVGSQIVGENSTHKELKLAERASDVKLFYFNTKKGQKAMDNSTATTLAESIGNYLKDNYKCKKGVKIYGFSVLDGYHSMMLTIEKTDKGNYEYYLFDQGPATSFWNGYEEFNNAEDVDKAITKYVIDMQDKRTKGGYKYKAQAELFLILNNE